MQQPNTYKDGDIVWVDLGPSYGWWPATVAAVMTSSSENASDVTATAAKQKTRLPIRQEEILKDEKLTFSASSGQKQITLSALGEISVARISDNAAEINDGKKAGKEAGDDCGNSAASPPRKRRRRAAADAGNSAGNSSSSGNTVTSSKDKENAGVAEKDSYRVHFFDDDKHECYIVNDVTNRMCLYTDKKRKLKLIRAGLKKFEAKKKGKDSMFDYRARQAQFYKDVEMAEVMTDNCIKVANILAKYQIVEDANNQ